MPIAGRIIPDTVDGVYVIKGKHWVLVEDQSRTLRLFESEPLTDEEMRDFFPKVAQVG